MKNFFKSIWNFFFKKEKEYHVGYKNIHGTPVSVYSKIKPEIPIDLEQLKKVETQKAKINSQLFRKHQLLGKIYNIGKHRYRIKQKIGLTESEKLRYQITQL